MASKGNNDFSVENFFLKLKNISNAFLCSLFPGLAVFGCIVAVGQQKWRFAKTQRWNKQPQQQGGATLHAVVDQQSADCPPLIIYTLSEFSQTQCGFSGEVQTHSNIFRLTGNDERRLDMLSCPPISELCTRVWFCFLMSSGTSGASALEPSVLHTAHISLLYWSQTTPTKGRLHPRWEQNLIKNVS